MPADRRVPAQPLRSAEGGRSSTPRDRYAALAALNEPPLWVRSMAADSGMLDLENYWLGELWNDLHHPQATRDQLNSREVASQFGAIARTLCQEGIGAGGAEPSLVENEPTGRSQAAQERIPRHWTSQGPPWFYALLGALAMACVSLTAIVMIVIALAPTPAPPADHDNIFVTVINDRYPYDNHPYSREGSR
jgi:hypothetical protein